MTRRSVIAAELLAALLLAVPAAAPAVTITVPLDGLAGGVPTFGAPRSDTFNFGMQFAEIESVLITIAVGEVPPRAVFLSAYLSAAPDHDRSVVARFSGLEPNSTETAAFEVLGAPMWPTFVFEGAGFVTIESFLAEPLASPGAGVLAAELSITGTPVPEPSALLLTGGAIAFLAMRARRRT